MSLIARELDFSVPQEVGTPNLEFPFEMNGDYTTLVITRHFKQSYAGWLKDRLSNTYPIGSVDLETGAFLISTARPALTPTGLQAFDRTSARIPLAQSVPSSLLLTKPALPQQVADQVVGSYYLNRPNSAIESYDAYIIKNVDSGGSAPSLYPTGGTYTLTFAGNTTSGLAYNATSSNVQTAINALTSLTTYGGATVTGTYNSPTGFSIVFNQFAQATISSSLTSSGAVAAVMSYPDSNTGGQGRLQIIGGYNTTNAPIVGGTFTFTIFSETTTAIAWNASVSTVAAAINALATVTARGGVTVTFPYSSGTAMAEPGGPRFGFSVYFTSPVFTASAASLTPAPSAITVIGGAANQEIIFAAGTSVRTLFITAHGISASDTIFLKGDGSYYAGIAGSFSVLNADSIQLTITGATPYAALAAITQAGKRTKAGYKPGTTAVRCLKVTNFYFPGISAGIPDFASIPLATNQSDAATFLQAVFAGTGNLNYQVGEISQWNNSPILQQTTTTIAVADI